MELITQNINNRNYLRFCLTEEAYYITTQCEETKMEDLTA